MARYIDADKFMERLKASPAFPNMGMDGYFLLDVVEELLKKFLTADVAPKSEVDWNSIPVDVSEALKQRAVEKAKTEVAREIFDEMETFLCRSVYPRVNANGTITPIISNDWRIRCDDYNAIKKKYTEVEG